MLTDMVKKNVLYLGIHEKNKNFTKSDYLL